LSCFAAIAGALVSLICVDIDGTEIKESARNRLAQEPRAQLPASDFYQIGSKFLLMDWRTMVAVKNNTEGPHVAFQLSRVRNAPIFLCVSGFS
jgi:hypothetical protein